MKGKVTYTIDEVEIKVAIMEYVAKKYDLPSSQSQPYVRFWSQEDSEELNLTLEATLHIELEPKEKT